MIVPTGTRAVFVVACLLLAGCSGLAGGDTVEREVYGVDERVQPTTEPDVPGLGENGVTNWLALWRSHVDHLQGTPYEATATVEYTGPNGTVLETEQSKAVVTGDAKWISVDTHRFEADGDATTRTVEQWIDDDSAAHRLAGGNQTTVGSGALVSNPATQLRVEPGAMFDAVETVTKMNSDQGTRYVLTGSGDVVPYQDSTFAIVVTEDGYIERLAFRGDGTRRGEPVTITIQITVDRVGDVIELERPDWAPAERETDEQ